MPRRSRKPASPNSPLFDRLRPLLEKAICSDTFEHHIQYVCANPVLLSPRILDLLRIELDRVQETATESQDVRQFLMARSLCGTVEDLRRLSDQFESGTIQFRLCGGPVEQIWIQLQKGEVAKSEAIALAERGDVVESLVPAYVLALSDQTVLMAHQGAWREGADWHRVVLAAVRAGHELPEAVTNLNVAEDAWVEIVLNGLSEVPDGRLFRDARDTGERVVRRTRSAEPGRHSLALHRLGILHLDPYIRGRDPQRYQGQYRLWEEAFYREHGPQAWLVPKEEWAMPPITSSLPVAADHLRKAAALRAGNDRGLSLKALIDALMWMRALGTQVDERELDALHEEASRCLDPKLHPDHIAQLALLKRQKFDTKGTSASASPIEPSGRDESLDVPSTVQLRLIRARTLALDDPAAALSDLGNARELFEAHGGEHQRTERRRAMATLLLKVNDREGVVGTSSSRWRELIARVEARYLTREPTAFAACVLGLANQAMTEDVEGQALMALSQAVTAAPALAATYDDVFRQVQSDLQFGLGSNHARSRHAAAAIAAYGHSLAGNLRLRNADVTDDLVLRLSSLADGTEETTDVLLDVLEASAADYELLLGEPGTFRIQELGRRLLLACFNARTSAGVMAAWRLGQVTKAVQFDRALANRVPLDVDSAEMRAVLSDVQRLEATANAEDTTEATGDDAETLLLGYVRPRDPGPGSGWHVRLENLQHRFDSEVRSMRAALRRGLPHSLHDVDEIRRIIGDSTVLLNLLIGEAEDDKLAIYGWLCSQRHNQFGRVQHELRAGLIEQDVSGRRLLTSDLANIVGAVRLGVQRDAAAGPVDSWTQEHLTSLVAAFPCVAQLSGLEAPARRHLCIVPHGPLHYFPFHLLGPQEKPLGTDWLVTYQPSLGCLRRRSIANPSRSTVTVVGNTFSRRNPRELTTLDEVQDEVQAIASAVGAIKLLDEQATPSAVKHALLQSRCVHIATHGSQNAVAPSFHCLYLSPDDAGVDRLFAYEIEALDLSGLQLVTLSACETALGRFDGADNIAGLPASLLQAGVETIIGTLWEVDTDACVVFFGSLYREIGRNVSKLDAFSVAQEATRRQFPAYRDWGAFYFIGAWN